MAKPSLFYVLIFCLAIHSGKAQTRLSMTDTLLIGTWKGTSICQVKNSPCHDEVVVYHISKNKNLDTFYINASKIVNGIEVEMGIVPCTYSKETNQLVSNASKGLWTFNIEGAKLEGTLVFHGDLYRTIKVVKQY
jgi:hypothetical protein